jgi:hypothetical protein
MQLLRYELDFQKARHADILRASTALNIYRQNSACPPRFWSWFLNSLGDSLIGMGKKVKCESQRCVEYSQIHA